MTRTVHTVTLTFEVSTTKTAEAVMRFIEEQTLDFECMVEQDLKDSACLALVKTETTTQGQSA